MKLELHEILARVRKTEAELVDYAVLAAQWERMYTLDPGFTKTWKESIEQEGRETIITPDPYNVVNLAMRLLANKPSINVPPRNGEVESIDTAKKMERWLQGMWYVLNWQQGRNLIRDGGWQSFVRGRHCYQVAWIKDELPEKMKDRFPILVRTLDPLNVGIKRGPLYTLWAFHKYSADKAEIRNIYPHLKLFEEAEMADYAEVEVIDWYHTDPKTGDVWNAVIVSGEFAKEPKKTLYPYIPIIEGYGDTAPVRNRAYEGISILHPMDGLWQYKCRLTSNMGTGVLWNTWPFFMILEPEGHTLPRDIVVRPGATEVFPAGTDFKQVMPDFNSNALNQVIQQVDTAMQQATFPAVMYGETGGTTSGWQVNLLSDTARGRIFSALDSLERTVQSINELVLALVEIMGDEKGVELYAFDKSTNKAYSETITPKDIDNYYRNVVELKPSVPKDEIALLTLLTRWYQDKLISAETARDLAATALNLPADEDTRVWLEQTLLDPELQPRAKLAHLKKAMPDTWEQFIKGSQTYEPLAIQMGLMEAPEPPMSLPGMQAPPPPPMGAPPPGMPNMPPSGGVPPPPPGMMPPGQPPAPGGMPGMLPPAPPGAPPPGMMPPGEMMPPPMGAPPSEAMLIPPQGGGIPPVMQGQPDMQQAGLPPGADPLLFAQLMGRQLPPAEELEMLQAQGEI